MLANRVRMGVQGGYVDTTGSPGPDKLMAGDENAGFFGEVKNSDFFTTEEVIDLTDVNGRTKYHDVGWLKFILDNKILFVSKQYILSQVSFNQLMSSKIPTGEKIVTKDGINYIARNFRSTSRPVGEAGEIEGDVLHYSEFNRLMLPIHEHAKNKSFAHPKNVEPDVQDWDINYTNDDLGIRNMASLHADSYNVNYSLTRGRNDISNSQLGDKRQAYPDFAWRAVLEVIE